MPLPETDRQAYERIKLPPGKTCGDCVFLKRCRAFFGCNPANTVCDWHPSRFREKPIEVPV